jgi:ABC-type multidrug transport system ATPase subunit
MLNGCEVDETRMAMVSSYIQQDDLFFGTLTVKEHLVFHVFMNILSQIECKLFSSYLFQSIKYLF